MQKKNSLALKWGIAAASALALTFGGVAPAMAANVNIGSDDVANFENGDESQVGSGYNYDQWHVGSNYESGVPLEDSLDFTGCSVTFEAHPSTGSLVQIMKGFEIDARPTSPAEMLALINSVQITVETGDVTIQIPMFLDAENSTDFTTFRSPLLAPGTYSLSSLAITASNANGIDLINDAPVEVNTFGDLFAAIVEAEIDAGEFEILGVGANGTAGASVSSLSFAGNTYYFGNGSCLPAVTPPTHVSTAAA